MIPTLHKANALAIAYDAEGMDLPAAKYFDSEYWRSEGALTGAAVGRGNSWFIDAPFGPVVLRQYLRGGWVARVSHNHYFFTTIHRSRPIREFFILASLVDLGLPVPRPVAALCKHKGILSSGALITETIAEAQTLADILPGAESEPAYGDVPWASIGKCMRKFHNAGLWHADLNARNILLDSARQVYLIDFDRARLTPGRRAHGKRNLSRLKRSLTKLWPETQVSALQPAWDQLMVGYGN